MSQARVAVTVPVLCLLAFAALVGCGGGSKPRASVPHPPPPEEAVAVALREWDSLRAVAYASGSVEGLRRLYVDGSTAGAADVRVLKRYVARGLVVQGMRMQVLALDVLRSTSSLMRVRVTDRLVGAEVRGSSGLLPLPRDAPSARVLTLRNVEGEWLMAAVSAGRT
jgi:hypothetical protein